MERINYMIGDWARIKASEKVGFVTRQVMAPDLANYHDREIEPIPLTPEILKKNGFSFCERDGGFYLYDTMVYQSFAGLARWDIEVVLFNVNNEYANNQLYIGSADGLDTTLHLMRCNNVHELQHALRLCGIEKEIVI